MSLLNRERPCSAGQGVQAPRGAPAHWLDLATKHMRDTNFDDVARALMIRSVLQMTVWDAITAGNDSKYAHLALRPFARVDEDDPIYTVMPTPSSPSHPSTSTTIAKAAATIMSHYFRKGPRNGWPSRRRSAIPESGAGSISP